MAGENIGRYNIILEFISDQKKLNDTLTNVDKKVTGFEASFKRAKVAFGAMISVAALQQIGSAIFDVTKKYQQYETILRVALGSQNKAEKALKLIQDTAKNTVFGVDELTSSYIKFVNRGINPTQAEIIKIADLAASQGKSFDQLTEAILDAQTGEFERLKEFGIKASQEGNKVSLSFRGMNQTIEKTPEAINAAIVSMGALNGIAGSNQAQMKNLSGIVSNLGDTFDQLFKAIGDTGAGVLGRLLSGFSSLVSKITEFISPTVTAREETMKLQKEFNNEIEVLKRLSPENEDRKIIIQEINEKYAEYLPNLLTEQSSIEEITRLQKLANEEFKRKLLYMAFEEELAEKQKKLRESLKTLASTETGRARSTVANTELGNIGASPGQLKQQEELYKNFYKAVEEGAQNNIAQTEADIDQLYKSYEKVAKDLNTTLEDLEKKFGSSEESSLKGATKRTTENAKKIKTELEKLNEEQKKLQDKLQNDLLKGLPVDDKAVSRINEINSLIAEMNMQMDNLFKRDIKDVPLLGIPDSEKQKIASFIRSLNSEFKKLYDDGVISEGTLNTVNLFEQALTFKGGLSENQKKEIADGMAKALEEGEKILRDKAKSSSNKDKPLLQTFLGLDDEQYGAVAGQLRTAEQFFKQAMDSMFNYELAMNQKRIDLQKTRVDEASKLAEKGKVEQLKIEEERLNELEKKQRAFAQAQRAIAAIEIATATGVAIANGIQAVTNGFKTGGPAGLALGIANSLALAAQVGSAVFAIKGALGGIPGYKLGIENVQGPGTKKSDSIFAKLSKHERVVDANNNEKIGFDFPNNKLPEAVALYKMFPSLLPHLTKSQPSEKINLDPITKRLEGIENFIQGLEVNVKLDSDGFATEIKRKFDSYDLVKRVVG